MGRRHMEVSKYLIDVPMEVKFPGVKKVGKTYMMRCPFHDDNTPSMAVHPEGRYYCFGCNERGGYISYIMKLYGLSFPEAVRKIEEITGLDFSDYYSTEHQKIIEINSEAAAFYRSCLTDEARTYLYARGINDESIERFSLGYAIGGNSILNHLLKKGYTQEEIRKAGLLKTTADHDFFTERLVIPIRNCAGIVGFSSRIINEKTSTKYLNTPETKVFKKSRLLYGLDSKGIKKHNFAILVEGYFDVIAMHQAGYNNTVAVMGTEVSDSHIEILKRYTDRIILAMDGDTAGRKATVKFLEKLILAGFDTAVAIFDDMDPDEFIRKGGDIRKVLESSEEGETYLCHALDDDKARKRFLYNVGINQLAPSVISSLEEKERIYFQEISSKAVIESLRERFNLIVRVKQLHIEVRRAGSILIAFEGRNFVCSKKIRHERFLKEEAKNLARIVAKSKQI
jgi:DNA primase